MRHATGPSTTRHHIPHPSLLDHFLYALHPLRNGDIAGIQRRHVFGVVAGAGAGRGGEIGDFVRDGADGEAEDGGGEEEGEERGV